MGEPTYWTCKIGPADRDRLPEGADSPLREAVADAFTLIMGDDAELISSGWGPKESDEPRLGLAATGDLLHELKARAAVSVTIGEYPREMNILGMRVERLLELLPMEMLDYRTVDQ